MITEQVQGRAARMRVHSYSSQALYEPAKMQNYSGLEIAHLVECTLYQAQGLGIQLLVTIQKHI